MTDMIEKLRAVFSCIRESGMKLATEKRQFGLRKIQFIGNTITSEGLTPISQKDKNFLKTFKRPKTIKQVKRIIKFFQFYKAFITELSKKFLPFIFLKKEAKFEIEEEQINATQTNK